MSFVRALLLLAVACGDNLEKNPAPCGVPRLNFTEIPLPNGEVGTTGIVFVPDTTDELLVLEKSGQISHYRLAVDTLELLGSFQVPNVRNFIDCGLITAVFDPITTQGRYLYVAHCMRDDDGRPGRIVRFRFEPPDYAGIVLSG